MNSAGRHRRGRQAGTAGAAGSCSPLPRRRGVGRWRVTAAWTTTPSAHRGAQCSKGEEAKIATRSSSSGSEAEIDSLTHSLTSTFSPSLLSSPPSLCPVDVLLRSSRSGEISPSLYFSLPVFARQFFPSSALPITPGPMQSESGIVPDFDVGEEFHEEAKTFYELKSQPLNRRSVSDREGEGGRGMHSFDGG